MQTVQDENIKGDIMPRHKNQKMKLMVLYDFLLRESSEKYPKSMSEILRYLQKEGIACERKSIYSDIDAINEFYKGKDGEGIIRGSGPYYVATEDRKIGYDKIRFLLDVVQSAAFLTEKHTNELSYAIKQLAGSRQQNNWDQNVVILNRAKHKNEQVFRSVEVIDEAISLGKKIDFKYSDLGIDGRFVYRRSGDYYTASPISLIFNNGFYYMIGYNENHNGMATYRLDRMRDVFLNDEDSNVSKQKEEFLRCEKKNLLTSFNMWNSDKTATVTLLVDNKLIGDIYDKFGMECELKSHGENQFIVKVGVPLNDQFYGWVTSFGTQMEILAPSSVRVALMKRLKATLDKYQVAKGE